MTENNIQDLIELGWEDEKIKGLTRCGDDYLQRMRKQLENKEVSNE